MVTCSPTRDCSRYSLSLTRLNRCIIRQDVSRRRGGSLVGPCAADLGKGKPLRSAMRSISWSPLLSARGCSVERDEFVDPRLHRFRQQRDISLRIVCGAEGVADLPLAQPCKPITDPADLRNGNVVEEAAALAAVIELYSVAFDPYDKLGLDIIPWLTARANNQAAGLAEG